MRYFLFRAARRAMFFFSLAVRARVPPADAISSRRCSARPHSSEPRAASFANSPVLAESRTAREGGSAGAVRLGASRSASSFFADELSSWTGRGSPKHFPHVALRLCGNQAMS